jgi:D-alanyl-D-alanine carboxypeptidase (penicillin-binding protein 5/6)
LRRLAQACGQCLVALTLALVAAPVQAAPAERFAAIVVDAETGETLYARHADAKRYPASLTKVMTLFLAFDAIDAGRVRLNDPVRISPRAAARPPSRLGLPVGAQLSVREAMDVMVVKSANDVATALGETLGGSEARFAKMMTAKAKSLGMAHTRFANASGLPDPRHYSTARDLATLGRAFLRDHPHDYAIFDQERTVFRGRVIQGHNRLLSRPGIDGFKTGFINASGFNLLTSGVRDGRRIVAVVLGGRTAATRDAYMMRLVRASFTSLAMDHAGFPITVAALLDPPPPQAAPPAMAPAVQLAALTTPPPKLEIVPKLEKDTPAKTAERWWIQVGAYSAKTRGQAKLDAISARHPHRFGDREQRVEPLGQLYAARFAARSADGAKQACAVLTADGDDCLPLVE